MNLKAFISCPKHNVRLHHPISPKSPSCWYCQEIKLNNQSSRLSVIPAPQEAEIRRIKPRHIVCETLSRKNKKKGGGVAQDVGSEFKLQYHTHTHTKAFLSWAGGMALRGGGKSQDQGPKFKPQHCQKTTTKRSQEAQRKFSVFALISNTYAINPPVHHPPI
jgi:hypothetical protein